ncbi:ankyrin repeat domain-containing protein [Zunongwangia sp. F363]|uniref:Ankyrin repeat domain-containing protein n=1 Tax=Autumnicola tepida TaxID=3075595 RepID=A0ABU3C8Y7_9FLAO|nr:ankyrin repeat domain-containing protein [Zunongwangia sp. F363]MDT0642803.1 ankyrin repeat domain-containing protein [Zunongwangia sp. F363]
MKTLKMNSVRVLLNLFLMATLFSACSQTNKKSNEQPVVEKSAMDIHAAVMANNLEVVRQHIEAGSNLNVKDNFSGSTPLNTAAVFGKTKIAKELIDAGADLSVKNNDGSTPLHTAAFFGRVEIVQMLIDAHADKTLRNNFGATPRETVAGPFSDMKPIYEMMQQQLAPLGLKLDMEQLQKNRPVIAMMLQ